MVVAPDALLTRVLAALGDDSRATAALSNNTLVISGVWEPDIERGLELIRRALGTELKTESPRVAYRSEGGRVLEPNMTVEVEVPEDFMGAVVGDLNRRRGIVLGMTGAGLRRITAEVPLVELIGYSAFLAGLTSRRGTATVVFSRYMEAPHGSGPQPPEPAAAALRA